MERTTVTQNSDEDTSKINFASGGLTITITPSRDTLANFEGLSLILSAAVSTAVAKIIQTGTGIGLDVDSDSTTNPAIKTDIGLTSTNFKRQLIIGDLTIWGSDGATADTNLTGTEGDICLNGGTGTGQCAFCTGTTNWTDM